MGSDRVHVLGTVFCHENGTIKQVKKGLLLYTLALE